MGLLDRFFKNKEPKRNKDTGTPLERYVKSFNHAIDGFIYCLKNEHNMIVIIAGAIFAIACGLYFEISIGEWLFILSISGAIAACEMLNSAIEAVVDLVTTSYHPLAKIAKDTASAATLILCITAFIGAILIFGPKIWGLY